MLKINLQSIQYFLKVAETLNFTTAARELYLSQPALSKQIRQLEEVTGVQLLKRNTKRVELTEGGKIMYQVWSNISRETEEALQRASAANSMRRQTLRIGILEFEGVINLLMPFLETFGEQQENLELEYSTYGFNDLKEKLKNRELDVIFSFSTEMPKESCGVVFKVLRELELNIIVPQKNHLFRKEELTVEDLKNETFYLFSNAYSDEMKQSIVQHCKKCGFYPAKMRYFPNITSLAVGLTCGNGVTIGYREFFNIGDDRLKFFPIPDVIGSHYIAVAWGEEKQEAVENILHFLDEVI